MRPFLPFALAFFPFLAFCQSPDPNFGDDGFAVINTGLGSAYLTAVSLQSDGAVVCVGVNQASGTMSIFVTRLSAGGQLDNTFGDNGYAVLSSNPYNIEVTDVAIQTDGRILVSGHASVGTSAGAVIWRLLPNGSLDTSFADGGLYLNTFSTNTNSGNYNNSIFTGLAVQPDGHVVASGWFPSVLSRPALVVVRLTATGALDSTFSDAGSYILDWSWEERGYSPVDLVLQPDGKILMGGLITYQSAAHDAMCLRLTADGVPDETFGTHGFTSVFTNTEDGIYTMHLQPDGRIVLAGAILYYDGNSSTVSNTLFVRLLANGTIDPSFSNGPAYWDVYGPMDSEAIQAVVMRADGQYVVCGSRSADGGVVSNGFLGALSSTDATPLSSFGTGGHYDAPFPNGSAIYNGLLQPDGKLVVVGRCYCSGDTTKMMVARFDVADALGITELANGGMLSIFPDPAQDHIMVGLPTDLGAHGTLSIMDPTGRAVLGPITTTGGQLSVAVDGLGNGLYLVVLDNGKRRYTSRFIKE